MDTVSKDFVEAVRRALYASKICAYAQGFGLIREASKQYGWNIKLGEIAKIFRGGCIIRAQFLNQITRAYEKNSDLVNLLMEEYFRDIVGIIRWNGEVVKLAISTGISVPAFLAH